MRALPDEPVFSIHDLDRLGWSRSARRNAVRQGLITPVRHGWYAPAAGDASLGRIVAAARAYPDGAVSLRSATNLYGLPIMGAPPSLPELTFPPRSSGNRHGIKEYRATLSADDVVLISGVATTSVARTLVDVARHLPAGRAVPLIDAALHRNLTTDDEIHDVLRRCWNWPGIRRAQRAVRLADARAESPLESVSRLVMGWYGVPRPELQTTIFDQYDRIVARGDFYWEKFGVVGEADGRSKYENRDVLFAEKERQEVLENLRLVVVRWGWELPVRRPHAFRARLHDAFDRGGALDRSGLPRLWSL
jgi:predicted transcriptional regulator of viral defense system